MPLVSTVYDVIVIHYYYYYYYYYSLWWSNYYLRKLEAKVILRKSIAFRKLYIIWILQVVGLFLRYCKKLDMNTTVFFSFDLDRHMACSTPSLGGQHHLVEFSPPNCQFQCKSRHMCWARSQTHKLILRTNWLMSNFFVHRIQIEFYCRRVKRINKPKEGLNKWQQINLNRLVAYETCWLISCRDARPTVWHIQHLAVAFLKHFFNIFSILLNKSIWENSANQRIVGH